MPQQLDSIVLTESPGTSCSAATTSGIVPSAFWWQWPCR